MNEYFRAMDNAIADLNEKKGAEEGATPYELFLAIQCLEYKFQTHQQSAYFRQTMEQILEKEKRDFEAKRHEQYK